MGDHDPERTRDETRDCRRDPTGRPPRHPNERRPRDSPDGSPSGRPDGSTGEPADRSNSGGSPSGPSRDGKRPATGPPATDPIVVQGLTKRFGDVIALRDVSLRVEPDTVHCVLGPNGSGKTTLFDVVLGLTRPTAGTVDHGVATLGCGFQTATYYPDLTVGENLATFGRMRGVDADWRDRVVDELGLEEVWHRAAGDLSGGWGKRLDLALAVLARPDYVVLDEPLDDLDDVVRRRVLDFFGTYRAEAGALLVATHRAAAFEGLADRVTVLDDGEVALDAAVADLDRPLEAAYLDRLVE